MLHSPKQAEPRPTLRRCVGVIRDGEDHHTHDYELRVARLFFFFFQAEDGIRDVAVTGVQTCALPIWFSERGRSHPAPAKKPADAWDELRAAAAASPSDARAQEDLAVLLQWRRPTDDAERMPLRAMERVTDLVPTEPEAALRLARLEDRDGNKRRGALEAALAAHPENAALLDALANYRLDRGEGWAALELARKAPSSAAR